jgi:hypothetical protein
VESLAVPKKVVSKFVGGREPLANPVVSAIDTDHGALLKFKKEA